MCGKIVRDVSGSNKNCYYILFHDQKKIYKVDSEIELNLVKCLNEDYRWYEKELDNYLNMGYVIIHTLKEL